MEGRILLKTLTKKSIIQNGKNKGLTVSDLLRLKKIDLIYSYYHYDVLTFTDEILDELGIKPEDKIEKPGKAPEKFKYYADRNIFIAAKIAAKRSLGSSDDEKINSIARIIKQRSAKKKFNAKYKRLIEKEKLSFSKSALMRKNHGH